TAVKSSVTGYLRGLATFPTRRSSDLGQGDIAELGIRQHFTLGCYASSWHVASLFSSGLSGNWRITAGPALLGSHRNRKSALGCLRALGAVLGATLTALVDTGGIEAAAHRVVAHTGEVLDTTAADQDHAVLLKVVAFTTDVGRHLVPVGETNAAHLAEGGVRLLRGGGVHAGAHTTALRTALQRGDATLGDFAFSRLTNQLVDRCHLLLLQK